MKTKLVSSISQYFQMKSNNPGTFVLHFSIIYLTSLLLQPIFESHLNRIKAVDIPYH